MKWVKIYTMFIIFIVLPINGYIMSVYSLPMGIILCVLQIPFLLGRLKD